MTSVLGILFEVTIGLCLIAYGLTAVFKARPIAGCLLAAAGVLQLVGYGCALALHA